MFKLSVAPCILLMAYHIAISMHDKNFSNHFADIGEQIDQMTLIAGVVIFAISGIGALGQRVFGALIGRVVNRSRSVLPNFALELIVSTFSAFIFAFLPQSQPVFYVSGALNIAFMVYRAYKRYASPTPS